MAAGEPRKKEDSEERERRGSEPLNGEIRTSREALANGRGWNRSAGLAVCRKSERNVKDEERDSERVKK